MEPQSFLAATLVAHVSFAIVVTVHAFANDREPGKWPFVALAFGLAGIAAYFFYDDSPGAGER
ncbi:hypothetical protein [Natrinema marinum]|uniref:hypothetical protein n=1 Tax=Natrinema marinum TaxID=2961598 RepID=UPI0020C8A56C|nr:hypothetical protein [Natrinema marinum]